MLLVATRHARRLIAFVGLVTLSGCRRSDPQASQQPEASQHVEGAVMAAEAEEEPAPVTSRPPKLKAASGQQIEVPAGKLVAGSTPGDRGRDPALEPALWEVELGSFRIDRLPYPNDPNQAPKTDVTREQAQALCEQQGKRLCTELEWERACKGPDNDAFASGKGWDPACAEHPEHCASGFDVLAMGGALREWTSSAVVLPDSGDDGPLAVLRGATAKGAATEHRCARRQPTNPKSHGGDIGFRCCSGPPNAAAIEPPKALPTIRRVKLDEAQVNDMIQSVPQLAHLGKVTFFKEPDDVDIVMARGDAGRGGNTLTTSALLWSPQLGEELLVLAGRGQSGSSFIAALYRLPHDRYRLASSFVLKDDAGPIVLGFNGWVRNRVQWSTCWGCLGEEGAVIYREPGRVVIEQL